MDWLTKLREMKKASRQTTKEIAEGSGIPEPTLEKVFAGIVKAPNLTTISTLVHYLGYTLDDLDEGAKKEAPPNAVEPPIEVEQLAGMLEQAGIVKSGADLTDADLAFLSSILDLISQWFDR